MFNKRIEALTPNQLETDAETTKGNLKHAKSSFNDYKRQQSCLGTKRKFENIKEDKCKQMRSSWQIDK